MAFTPPPQGRLVDAMGVGERTYLRSPTVKDSDEFLYLMRVSRGLHRPWVATMDAEGFMSYVHRGGRPDVEALLICRRDDDTIAGFVNLSQIFYGGFCNATCGYAAFLPSVGQGLLTEGFGLTLSYAFESLRLHRVEANIQPGNTPSRALAERCGLRFEGFSPRYLKISGRWRDHERWAITVEEWRDQRRQRRLGPLEVPTLATMERGTTVG